MTLSHSPNIVRDGLVLALDPANKKSLKPENQLQYSEQFDTVPWYIYNSTSCTITPNAISGPFGGSAYLVIGSTSTALFYQTLTTGAVGTGKKIASIYAKAYSSNQFTLNPYYVGDTEVNITFTLTGNGSTNDPANSIIESIGNGWYRCSVILPARINSGTSLPWRIWPEARGTYTTKGCYFWGAQLRDAFSGEEYIKTESSAIYESTNIINMVDSSVVGTPSGKSPSNLDNSLSYLATDLSYIGFPSLPEIQFLGNSPYTLEAWVCPTINPGASNWTGIFDRESNPGIGRDGYNLYFLGSSGSNTYFTSDRFVAGSGVYPSITVDQSQSVNNWNHIIVRYDGINAKIYRNTVSGSSFASTGSITNTSKQLTIGVRGGQYFTGKIGITNIYNIALSDDQIKQNFNALRGRYGI
jgi:hypothetical protein